MFNTKTMEHNNSAPVILLSVAGTASYGTTCYQFENRISSEVPYSVVALNELFKPARICVLMTREAEEKQAEGLSKYLTFDKIAIPGGKNETELWQIFQQVAEAIPANATLIIDVTNGFRSLPMLLLSIAVYLQAIKAVSIQYIVYGAFENKNSNNVTPLFNLYPFLDLISWSVATGHFARSGDAGLLAGLVIPVHNNAHRSANEYLPKALKTIGKTLDHLTAAQATVRSHEIAEQAHHLLKRIPECFTDVDNMDKVKPFKALLEKIESTFRPVAGGHVDLFSPEGLTAQAEMIRLYLANRQYQQATTLARELMVTQVCVINAYDCLEPEERRKAADLLNDPSGDNAPEQLRPLLSVWKSLANIRNDINHAGMRKNPIPANTLTTQVPKNCLLVYQHILAINNPAPVH